LQVHLYNGVAWRLSDVLQPWGWDDVALDHLAVVGLQENERQQKKNKRHELLFS
jgi:hypothetical protein